jgi:hypothetical protein
MIQTRILIRNLEAQKLMDPTDPDPITAKKYEDTDP